MTYLLDSNLIIAYFRTSELDHAASKDFIRKLDTFCICDYTLLEVMTVMLLKENKKDVERVLNFLRTNKDVTVLRLTQAEIGEALSLFIKQSKKASFTDISLMVLAKNRGLQLATFDTELSKTAKELFRKK